MRTAKETAQEISKRFHDDLNYTAREQIPMRIEQLEEYIEEAIQSERTRAQVLIDALEFYADGAIRGDDLEILPEKEELWSIPDKWALRSMSDHWSGKRARQALAKYSEEE